MDPTTAQEWIDVAGERAQDAEAIFRGRPDSAGAVYMAGYAVECILKAYLHYRDGSHPRIHDVRALWKQCGFTLAELRDKGGAQTFFVEHWSIDLRYRTHVDLRVPPDELLQGARQLCGRISTYIKRSRPRRPR